MIKSGFVQQIERILSGNKKVGEIISDLRNFLVNCDLTKITRIEATAGAVKIGSFKTYVDQKVLESYQNYIRKKQEIFEGLDKKVLSVAEMLSQNTPEFQDWQEKKSYSKALAELKALLNSHSWALKEEQDLSQLE